MSRLTSILMSGARAGAMALVLGAVSITALPAPAFAQANPAPSFNFELNVPGGSVEFGVGNDRPGRDGRDRDRDDRDRCLSDRQISRGLREEGFRNIDFVRELRRNRVEIVAQYGRSYYLLRADRCRGSVEIIERLRRNRGFGLQFNF